MISLRSFRSFNRKEFEHLLENTGVETYTNLRNYCNTVGKSRKASQYWPFRGTLFLTCDASARIKNCFNILKWPVVSLKLVRNCVTFRIQRNGAKKLIFFKLVLALILKIYLKLFNGRNYCYNRSGT